VFQRGIDSSDPDGLDPVGRLGGQHEVRPGRSPVVATGTLACPRCDAPVTPGGGPVGLRAPLTCPFCEHGGPVRDFLSLAQPTRPTHVVVRIAHRMPHHLRP
jgi:hypothetical protein